MSAADVHAAFATQFHQLLDVAKCYEFIRQLRWSDGAAKPFSRR